MHRGYGRCRRGGRVGGIVRQTCRDAGGAEDTSGTPSRDQGDARARRTVKRGGRLLARSRLPFETASLRKPVHVESPSTQLCHRQGGKRPVRVWTVRGCERPLHTEQGYGLDGTTGRRIQ